MGRLMPVNAGALKSQLLGKDFKSLHMSKKLLADHFPICALHLLLSWLSSNNKYFLNTQLMSGTTLSSWGAVNEETVSICRLQCLSELLSLQPHQNLPQATAQQVGATAPERLGWQEQTLAESADSSCSAKPISANGEGLQRAKESQLLIQDATETNYLITKDNLNWQGEDKELITNFYWENIRSIGQVILWLIVMWFGYFYYTRFNCQTPTCGHLKNKNHYNPLLAFSCSGLPSPSLQGPLPYFCVLKFSSVCPTWSLFPCAWLNSLTMSSVPNVSSQITCLSFYTQIIFMHTYLSTLQFNQFI